MRATTGLDRAAEGDGARKSASLRGQFQVAGVSPLDLVPAVRGLLRSFGHGLLRENPAAFGGRDQLQGGTWFGINEHGLVVGLTNLAGGVLDPSRRSRGLLVVELLARRTARQVERSIASADSSNELVALLEEIAREHQHASDPRYRLCCHYGGHGTRSSTILFSGGRELLYLHSEGAPCQAPYEDLSSQAVKVLRTTCA